MSFAEHLAEFRTRHPDIEVAEVYISDLNGVARGKLVPADMLDKMTGGGMKLPISTLGLDIFGCDVPESAIALETGDPDGNLIPVAATLAPMLWAGRPTAQLQCMMTDAGGAQVCGYDPRGVLARVTERARKKPSRRCSGIVAAGKSRCFLKHSKAVVVWRNYSSKAALDSKMRSAY